MELQNRKNPRLECFDYSTCGAYFVTICTHNRCRNLARICRDDPCGRPKAALLPLGQIAADAVVKIQDTFHVVVDQYVIMPDHIHLIVFLTDGQPGENKRKLGRVIGGYKSIVSNQWLKVCKAKGEVMGEIWQERYYDHIIRNDQDLRNVREYIETNPDRWVQKHWHT